MDDDEDEEDSDGSEDEDGLLAERGVHDVAEGVLRCVDCAWEIVAGACVSWYASVIVPLRT
jgi:hypothetical protein